MSKNTGKLFEEQWRKSTPNYALLYRLPDAAQSFDRSTKLRFSSKNPFDFLLWDSKRKTLFALEIKTVAGKAITFERNEDEVGEIHFHQIKGLNKWDKYDGIVCGFIIEFRGLEKTVFIDIKELNKIIEIIPKKSFNYHDLDSYNIKHIIIGQKKARTRFTYDVDEFLNTIKV